MFTSRWLLKPGPTAERPITLVIENPSKDEDGSRATIAFDLTLEEAGTIQHDFEQARTWVRSGAWRPGR